MILKQHLIYDKSDKKIIASMSSDVVNDAFFNNQWENSKRKKSCLRCLRGLQSIKVFWAVVAIVLILLILRIFSVYLGVLQEATQIWFDSARRRRRRFDMRIDRQPSCQLLIFPVTQFFKRRTSQLTNSIHWKGRAVCSPFWLFFGCCAMCGFWI